jgi:hypothetical protein
VTTAERPLIVVQSGPRNARTDPDSGIRYYTWQGREYPSVTSIRNLAGMPIKLAQWRTNQVIDRAITDISTLNGMISGSTDPKAVASWLRQAQNAKRDAAAALGTKVHDAAQQGLTLDKVGPEVAPFLKQYLSWVADTGIEIVLQERQVWSLTEGYAGTFDLIGRFPKTGDHWLIDLKTGSGVYPEHALQTSAYAEADFVGEDDVVDDAATDILHSVGQDHRAVLHLRPDGWVFKTLPHSDETWRAFKALLAFALWVDANPSLDNLIGATKEGHA